MTMQMLDTFTFRSEKADVIAISERFKFTPFHDFGIKTISWITSNHRGFWCDYVIDKALMVQNLYLVSKDLIYPTIIGTRAYPEPQWLDLYNKHFKQQCPHTNYADHPLPMHYVGLNYKVDYSGLMVIAIGTETVDKSQSRYRQVLELQFEHGDLTGINDITESWRAIRTAVSADSGNYWWINNEYSYIELINFRCMGEEYDDG